MDFYLHAIAVRSDLILHILQIGQITSEEGKLITPAIVIHSCRVATNNLDLSRHQGKERGPLIGWRSPGGGAAAASALVFLNSFKSKHFSLAWRPGGGGQCKSVQNDCERQWQMLCLMPFNTHRRPSRVTMRPCVRASMCVSLHVSAAPLSALEPLSSPSNYFIMQMSHHYFISEAANHRS